MTLLSIPNHDIPTHAPFSPAMVRKLSQVATQQPRHDAASERHHIYQVMETRPKCNGWWLPRGRSRILWLTARGLCLAAITMMRGRSQGVPTTFTVLSRAKSIRLIGEVEKSGSHSVNSLFCAAFSSDAYMFLNTILNANHRC